MNENDKEYQIFEKIREITGKVPDIESNKESNSEKNLDYFKIQNILILSNSYDFFLLEEEGRLQSLFLEMYAQIEGKNHMNLIG
jgi:hypothetical protein